MFAGYADAVEHLDGDAQFLGVCDFGRHSLADRRAPLLKLITRRQKFTSDGHTRLAFCGVVIVQTER